MFRKCIGVIIGQPDDPYQVQVLQGVAETALAADCNVAVFSSMIRSGGYTEYQLGEARVMELIQYDLLDGIIVVPDTLLMTSGFAGEVFREVRENFAGPKAVLDMEEEGYASFLCNDKTQVKLLIRHMIKAHGCTDIAYITGPKEHPHSQIRLAGYREALAEAGIAYEEDRVYYGTFWYETGELIVPQILESKKGLPEVIACACDTMAISVRTALEARGIRVPEDVKVTGFDCEGNEINEPHTITSAARTIRSAATQAVRFLLGLPQKPAATEQELETLLYKTDTCGCAKERGIHENDEKKKENANFFSLYNYMAEKLISTRNIKDCLWKIDWYANQIGCYDRMYFCLTENWKHKDAASAIEELENQRQEDDDAWGDRDVLLLHQAKEPLSDRMYLVLDKVYGSEENHDERVDLQRNFDRKLMIPALHEKREKPAVFYFNMLHFGRDSFGYIVLEYSGGNLVYDNRYPFWMRNVNNALESMRQLYAIKYMYDNAKQQAISDRMTGMYNRNGYNILLPQMMETLGEQESLLYMLFDNNELKHINDTYGHTAGDEVIKLTAAIISKKYFGDEVEEKNFRIGGDEYVKLVRGKITREQAEQCAETIQKQFDEINASGARRYPIHVAAGYQIYPFNVKVTPDQVMKEADTRMYANKLHLKQTSGSQIKQDT